jgi:hypothetical protein
LQDSSIAVDCRCMKFLGAILVYLGFAAVIGLGMVLAVQGKPWLLLLGGVGFLLAFARIGCVQD